MDEVQVAVTVHIDESACHICARDGGVTEQGHDAGRQLLLRQPLAKRWLAGCACVHGNKPSANHQVHQTIPGSSKRDSHHGEKNASRNRRSSLPTLPTHSVTSTAYTVV